MIYKIAKLDIKKNQEAVEGDFNWARWRLVWVVKVVYFCGEKMFYDWDKVRNQSISDGIFGTGYGETESSVSYCLEINPGKEVDTESIEYAFTGDLSDWQADGKYADPDSKRSVKGLKRIKSFR